MAIEPNEHARTASAISKAMTQMHREHYGRGATSVRTVISHDHVVSFLEDILTPMERTLVDAGEVEPVREARLAFQRAMRVRFIETIENATGRKVRAFLSQVHFDPDIAAEVFVLEPNGKGQTIESDEGASAE
ncbi:MAG: Na-translocating system protein MpsC family protein [Gaiellaceae bacterium]